MRITPIRPTDLTHEQRALDDQARNIMDGMKAPFTSTDEDDALIGPFPVMLRFADHARPLLEWFTSVSNESQLAPRVREVAILTIGARFGAGYELYSHSRIALSIGMSDGVVAALAAGQRPPELTPEELVAHDVAACLYAGAPLPGVLYRRALASFGDEGTAELVFLTAQYACISMVLNAYDVPLPPDAE
ncbi:carboxymuconolactone decarboxylase family protein [Streptomyces sp. NPDC050788]|uniref:carboxymuconolactone decarboxylase family protein n=1 Tax=Streptomyces sp. NPDC050788 TaxID=3155041 RepID=UPI00343082EE